MEWLLRHAGAGIFASPGSGKTGIVERAVLALKDAKVFRKALVVAPLRVAHKVWPNEAYEWRDSAWDRIQELKVVVLHGPHKEQLLHEPADIYVINFDGLPWLFSENYRRWHELGHDTLIIDESSKFKKTNTKRFKGIKPVLSEMKRRWILTGSPNPNSYLDLFGQIFIIDLGKALTPFITHYRGEFFHQKPKNIWKWFINDGAEKRITKLIAPYIFRLDAGDFMELPELVDNIVRIDLPEEARAMYDEMEEELYASLKKGINVLAANKAAAYTKCSQIANGGLYYQEINKADPLKPDDIDTVTREFQNIHLAKIEAVEDIVEELQGSPAMVVFDTAHDLSRLLAKWPETPYIAGGISPKKSNLIIDAWNRSELELLFVQPQTVSHGLNMQKGEAHHIIWHSLTYDYEIYDQLIRRLLRQGSKHKKIFNHLIVARETTDEAKLTSIRRKHKTQKAFLDALKEYTLRRWKARKV